VLGSPQTTLRLANTSRRYPCVQGTCTLWKNYTRRFAFIKIICIFAIFLIALERVCTAHAGHTHNVRI